HIEAGQEFDQKLFIKLMKLVPQRVFNEDSVQRIIRFVKQHSKITERDFLEALDLADQALLGLALKQPQAGKPITRGFSRF
ncbi:hypothetical protein HK100_008292, partial [Physocladia obscura]